MKKSIKHAAMKNSSPADKKNARPFTTGEAGYKENIYNREEQDSYKKGDAAKGNKKNTAGPKD